MKLLSRQMFSFAVMLLGVFSFRYSIAEPYVVPTGSMKPTILPGDYLLVLKSAYDLKVPFTGLELAKLSEPARGDIVVFQFPKDPKIHFVKRLIAVPGDDVEVSDGFVTINGKPLELAPADRARLARLTSGDLPRVVYEETLGSVTHVVQRLPHEPRADRLRFRVPEGQYFFMGDNRDDSNDSRFWGYVPKKLISGKALGIWMSLDREHGWLPKPRLGRLGPFVGA